MKKYLLLIVALVATCMSVNAEGLSARGIKLRTNIKTFLGSSGYSPEIDGDGDIKFKAEGKTYYVSVEDYGNEFYVETFGVMGTEDTNRKAVLEAANKSQKSLKFVRVNVSNTSLSYGCVQAINSVAEYEHTFEDFISILKKVRERIVENYDE